MPGRYEIRVTAIYDHGLMEPIRKLSLWSWHRPTPPEVRDIIEASMPTIDCQLVHWKLYAVHPLPRPRTSSTWGNRKVNCPRVRLTEGMNPPSMIWGNFAIHR